MQSLSIIKSTTIVRASLLLLAGGFAAQHSRVLLSSDLLQWLFVATLALFLSRHCRFVALVLLGYVVFMHAGIRSIEGRLDARYEGDSMLAQVRVVDFPKSTNTSVSLLVQPVNDHRLPRLSRVNWFEPPQTPQLGETWELELRLRRPRGSSNPGGFRFEDWMFRESVFASGYVVPGKRNRLLTAGPGDVQLRLRREFAEFATANVGESVAVIVAVGIGARHLLSAEQWDRYARTGTSHLMAISGLHIGLAATAAFVLLVLLFGGLRLQGNHLQQATIGAALVATGYALVSGFAVPSQRATLMLGLAALAFSLRRRRDSPRLIAVVATVVFMLDPVSLLRPGFSLSFAAVVVLLWISNIYERRDVDLRFVRRMSNTLRQITRMQFALLFGLIPLTIVLFNRVSLLAPLANIVAVPVFSLVTVPLTLIALITFAWFPVAARLILQVTELSIAAIEKSITLFVSLPFSNLTIATSGIHWCLVLLPALWVLLPRSWPGRWLAPLAVLALIVYRPAAPRPDCFDLHVLDVGQGLSVVVRTGRHTLLFDTGADYRGGSSAMSQAILPFLRHRGLDAIDWLIVSHADNDHAGGVAALLSEIQPDRIFVGEAVPNLSAGLCRSGYRWIADGVRFEFHHPEAHNRRQGNDASCVLSIDAGSHRVLLTGDIEEAAERDLLQAARINGSDIVVIPHHGSLTSSSRAFVARLQPRLAIASAAYGNRWGFPRPEVVKRWQDAGATVLDTASSGAISVSVCANDGIRHLHKNRELEQRFWHESTSN